MSLNLRVGLLLFSVIFLVAAVRLVSRGRLQLKYALLWLLLGVLMLLVAVFPDLAILLSQALGVGLTSNFVFLCGLLFLLTMCLSLSVIVSWQARDIRSLVQQVALLRKDLDECLGISEAAEAGRTDKSGMMDERRG